MSLGVKNPFIQRHNIIVRKNEVEVFKGFSKQKTLLDVIMYHILLINIFDTRKPARSLITEVVSALELYCYEIFLVRSFRKCRHGNELMTAFTAITDKNAT